MENKIRNFKDLKIWNKGIELVKIIYHFTNVYPSKEIYGLVSQMRRASVSIPSNIAEGFMRRHNKEYKQFLYIALGSLAELETQIIISEELTFITKEKSMEIQNKINELNKMTISLIKCL
ncbi:MAG: four helix bundle protein [bacterium]